MIYDNDFLDIYVIIRDKSLDEIFLNGLLKKSGFKYYPDRRHKSGYYDPIVKDSVYNPSLNKAIKTIIKEGSGTFFALWYDEIDSILDIKTKQMLNSTFVELVCSIDRVYLKEGDKNVQKIIKLITNIYDYAKPVCIFADMNGFIVDKVGDIYTHIENVLRGNCSKLTSKYLWLNIFSKDLVDELGRKKLMAIKGYKTIVLNNGGILILRSKIPYDT